MTDRPILFSAPMVRALLAGTKTQTRRLTKVVQPDGDNFIVSNAHGGTIGVAEADVPRIAPDYVINAVGDRLWVREAWRVSKRWDDTPPRDLEPRRMSVVLEAGGSVANEGDPLQWIPSDWPNGERPDWIGRLRPGIHMPRWVSRLTLTVTDVRVERLQDISEADARAEGCSPVWSGDMNEGPSKFADEVYAEIWDEINGAGAWGANPWVSATTFTVHHQNIDAVRSEAA